MRNMHLDLPGFPEGQRDLRKLGQIPQRESRIQKIASSFASQPRKPYEKHKFTSGDIDDRISWIEYEINVGKRSPEVRQIAAGILTSVPARDWEKEAVACFKWTRKNVRYTLDPHNVELFQSATRSREVGIGDCDDQAIMLSSLLQCVGIPVRLRIISLAGQRQFSHIYVLAGLPPDVPTKWLPLDASRPEDAGWELPEGQRGRLQDYDVDDYDPDEN